MKGRETGEVAGWRTVKRGGGGRDGENGGST